MAHRHRSQEQSTHAHIQLSWLLTLWKTIFFFLTEGKKNLTDVCMTVSERERETEWNAEAQAVRKRGKRSAHREAIDKQRNSNAPTKGGEF